MNNAPFITTEGFYGTTSIDLEARHLTNGKIFLNGEITSQTADNFVKAFLYLKEKENPVTIYINTPGGSVEAGLVIYDLIQGAKDMEIHMVCTGSASSMGAIILAGGQNGRRHILKHSKVMIHEPLISNGFGGSATSIQSISESIMDTKKILNEILAKHTGKSKKEIDKVTMHDHFMNAEESIAFGICDDIVESI